MASGPKLILSFSECHGPADKGHCQKRSSAELGRGETVSFLFIHSSSGNIFISKLPLSERYFMARAMGDRLCKYILMLDNSVSFPVFPRKALRFKKKNKFEKTTLNQHLSCVDLWICYSGNWWSWIYCIFPFWGLEGLGRGNGRTTCHCWFLTLDLNVHFAACIHKSKASIVTFLSSH